MTFVCSLAGSVWGGQIYDHLRGHLVMALMIVLMAALTALTPVLPLLWIMTAILFFTGAVQGLLNIGGNAMLLIPALVLLPIVLRTAEDVTHRAVAEMIEETEDAERPSVWQLLLRGGLFGLGLGSAVALLVFAIAEPALTMGGGTPSDTWIAVAIASSTGLAVFLVMLAGVGVTQYARKQFDADKKVSGVALGLGMMVLATVIYLALSLGGGIVLVLALGA